MAIPEPFTAVAFSAGVITNLATDILKHRSQYAKNPLMVRALKWAGFRETEFEERIHNTLVEALTIYFETNEAFRIQGIVSFFKHPVTAQQIADYVMDGKQIDQSQLQALLEQSISQQTISQLLIKKRDLDIEQVVPSFLSSYQKALNRHLSVPQMAIMSKLLVLENQQVVELKASEDRLKQFISDLLSERNSLQNQDETSLKASFTSTPKQARKRIRWLHLSDFHTGKDNYGQRQLFRYILSHIRNCVTANAAPDLIFITGDIANKGKPEEYDLFNREFLFPLQEIVGEPCARRIFIIPGNHDVDRNQARAVKRYGIFLDVPEFLDPTQEGLNERQYLFPRFEAFVENDFTADTPHWLSSTEGFSTREVEINGCKLGVLSLNTAWLSGSDDDRHQMSFGKGMLEEGLNRLEDCDFQIVLGHHPLDWLRDEELLAVRSLLGKHNALYLHGHMHRTFSRFEEGGGFPFLAIQTGACFQAREDEKWVNRLLWGVLDPDSQQLCIEPLRWSLSHQEWSLDGDAFPNKYRQDNYWVLNMPVTSETLDKEQPEGVMIQPPYGWLWIGKSFLNERRRLLEQEEIIRYFDGSIPSWKEALSPQIPRREVVGKILGSLRHNRTAEKLAVTVLLGAGGEGKSTALRQVVCDIVSQGGGHVLWRRSSVNAKLSPEFVLNHQFSPSETLLIVSDEADAIATQAYELVMALREKGRTNVQFLLCCRDTDWYGVKAHELRWDKQAIYTQEQLQDLSIEDASRIVSAWSEYGEQGMGQLSDLSQDEATRRFFEAAKEQNVQDGTFLGAMLQVRYGEALREHVRTLLLRLEEKSAPGGTLVDAFAYIAATHAENIQSLSNMVLAKTLGCTIRELQSKVLRPLGNEAALTISGQYILTRHRTIAEVAMDFLTNAPFDVQKDDLFVELVRSAIQLKRSGEFVPDLPTWRFLSSKFFAKGYEQLGIRLARTLVHESPTNSHFLTNLAKLLREAGEIEQSVEVFRSLPTDVRRDRALFYEWATVEGNADNQALDAWLSGVSLADQTEKRPPDNKRSQLSLAGIGIAFRELYHKYNYRIFIESCGASAQLGLSLDALNTKTRSNLEQNLSISKANGVNRMDLRVAFELLRKGILEAWEQREDDLPEWVPAADRLTFEKLSRVLRL